MMCNIEEETHLDFRWAPADDSESTRLLPPQSTVSLSCCCCCCCSRRWSKTLDFGSSFVLANISTFSSSFSSYIFTPRSFSSTARHNEPPFSWLDLPGCPSALVRLTSAAHSLADAINDPHLIYCFILGEENIDVILKQVERIAPNCDQVKMHSCVCVFQKSFDTVSQYRFPMYINTGVVAQVIK